MNKKLIALLSAFLLSKTISAIPIEEAISILQNRWIHYNLGEAFDYTFNGPLGDVTFSAYTDSTKASNDSLKREGGIDLESIDATSDKEKCNVVGVFYKYFNPNSFSDSIAFSDSVDIIIIDSLLGGSNITNLNQTNISATTKADTVFLNFNSQNPNVRGYNILRKKITEKEYQLVEGTEQKQYKDVFKNYGIFNYQINSLASNGKILNTNKVTINKVPTFLKQKTIPIMYFTQEDKNKLIDLNKKGYNIYDVSGRKTTDFNKISQGKYFAKIKNLTKQ